MSGKGVCFTPALARILPLDSADMKFLFRRPKAPSCEKVVAGIISKVQSEGDSALEEYAKSLDRVERGYSVRVPKADIGSAYGETPSELVAALKFAAANIREVCEKTKPKDKTVATAYAKITQKAVPLDSVGIYAPGGRAAYPSTVLMCAIPARVAGVRRIALCSPPPVPATILVAAEVCGIEEVYAVGGAQAIAAMAHGTMTVPKMDKIVGPGNQFVTEAKRQVRGFGVDIDMLAGPTEIFIVADGSSNAAWVAADTLAQLEHGPDSAAMVITTEEMAGKVSVELEKQLEALPRREIAEKSLKNSAILTTDFSDLRAIADVINSYAPEHLELQTRMNAKLLSLVRNAGAVFMGSQSCEAFGDYCAGSNHVLPTGGSVRFSSCLSVAAFTKVMEVVEVYNEKKLARNSAVLARWEGLEGHARSAEKRAGK